jgi:hypothetical protein
MPRLVFRCPHCNRSIAPGPLKSYVGKMYNRLHTPTGPPKVLRPCPFCRKKFGCDELRAHKPQCPKKRRQPRASKTILPIRTVSKPKPSPFLLLAEDIAREAHAGQTEESTGDSYIKHVERVVDLVEGDDAKAVAWLHDVIEDSPNTADDLIARGMPMRIVAAVALLTRHERTETYADYIQNIKARGDPLAIAVKLADLKDHFRPNCPARLRPRYEKAWKTLTGQAYKSGQFGQPVRMRPNR